MRDFDKHWLEETTNSLLDNYTTFNMVHMYITKISEIAKSSSLHINNVLCKYGKDEI